MHAKDGIKKSRITGIDALRGLAVILMVEQHMGIWLWDKSDRLMDFFSFPVIISLNAMGGFAAPAFITLSGVGAVLLTERFPRSDAMLAKRGIMVIAFGYLLNILTPSWFSWGSWYVLHMIGAGFILTPLLRRMKTLYLPALFVICIIIAVALQNSLDTPLFIYNDFMRNTDRPGGLLRLVIAEGQFPLFPWLALVAGGVLAGRWIIAGNIRSIVLFAACLLIAGGLLSLVHFIGPEFTRSGILKRAFWFYPGFYPAHPPMFLILASLVQFAIAAVIAIERKVTIGEGNFLVVLGRSSLTILFVHIFLFREMTRRVDLWKYFSSGMTLAVIAAVVCLFALLALLWKRAGYRYGFEWLMRRFD